MAWRRQIPRDPLAGLLLGMGSLFSAGCPQLLSDEFTLQTGNEPRLASTPTLVDPSRSPGSGSAGGSSAPPEPSTPDDTPDSPGMNTADGPHGNPPSDPDGGSVAVNEPGPPSVLSVSPSDGAIGVLSDVVVTLTFSEAMNTSSVELAYASYDLPANAVSFSWTDGATVLHITPDQPLEHATGGSAATTSAIPYAFQIASTALDQEGSPLPGFTSAFSVVREITQTLDAVRDRSLTGNWRTDDSYGSGECEERDITSCVGDSSNGNSAYRGFLTFDLSAIPSAALAATAARLRMQMSTEVGDPFSSLGNLGVERVSFDRIGPVAFGASPLGAFTSVTVQSGQLSADVLAAVNADLPAHTRSQFRMRFSIPSDQNGAADLVASEWTTQTLQISYLIP